MPNAADDPEIDDVATAGPPSRLTRGRSSAKSLTSSSVKILSQTASSASSQGEQGGRVAEAKTKADMSEYTALYMLAFIIKTCALPSAHWLRRRRGIWTTVAYFVSKTALFRCTEGLVGPVLSPLVIPARYLWLI